MLKRKSEIIATNFSGCQQCVEKKQWRTRLFNLLRIDLLPLAKVFSSIARQGDSRISSSELLKGEIQMSNQPPYGNPPGGYPPPPGGYQGGGGYPPPQGGGFPPPGGYQGGGGYGGPPPENKTKTLGLSYNVAALLCYLPTCLCCINLIPCILWLATEPKENRFLRFHALQGLILFGIYFVLSILLQILSAVVDTGARATNSGFTYFGGNIIMALLSLAFLVGFLVIHIIAMVKANQGQMWKIPVIGDIAEKNS